VKRRWWRSGDEMGERMKEEGRGGKERSGEKGG
jgi:hypothetical protein